MKIDSLFFFFFFFSSLDEIKEGAKTTIHEAGHILNMGEFLRIGQILNSICNFMIKYPHLWLYISRMIVSCMVEVFEMNLRTCSKMLINGN